MSPTKYLKGPCDRVPQHCRAQGQYPPHWHYTLPLGEPGTAPMGCGVESDFHGCEKALRAKALLGLALKRNSSLHTSMAPSPTALGPAPPSGACGATWRAVKRLPGGRALRGLSPELPKLP